MNHFLRARALINLGGGGGGQGTDHDHNTLELDPLSMVKKFDHGHWHPKICHMVNGQKGYFVVKLRGWISGLTFWP